MKTHFTLTVFMLATIILQAQSFQWATGTGSTNFDYVSSVKTDASGNVYITGFFQGTIDFDPGTGTYNLSSNGATDVFVEKLDAAGNFLWAKSFGGTGNDESNFMNLDASGNLYIVGVFAGAVDFDPGTGVANLTSNGTTDAFLQKLDANGNFIWVKSLGGNSTIQYGNAVSVDFSGNVYTTGYFYGTLDFDPGTGVSELTSNGGVDVFIQKLDNNGNFLWAKSFGGSGNERGKSIAIDTSGNVFTTGYYTDTADFDPGTAVFNLTSNYGYDIFVQKLDPNGNFVWAKSFGSSVLNDYGNSVATDASGNVYTGGYFGGTVDFDPGSGTYSLTADVYDVFIQKMDSQGNFLWAKSFGGPNDDEGNSIALDTSGNVYTTGFYRGTVDFDPGAGIYSLTSSGNSDVFIQKLDSGGNFKWAKSFGGSGNDEGHSIAVNTLGDIYTAGLFFNTVDFDPDAGVYTLTSTGSADIFVQKLNDPSQNLASSENAIKSNLRIYPNPATDFLNIQNPGNLKISKAEILDLNGRLIKNTTIENTKISVEKLPKGMYFLKIITEKGIENLKFIKK
ncbi:SBBP repeat-containing protein [Chryseobacterium koreense]|nr:SBBP repeat-containing protein [Chryseobacterium koreense]MBB5332801.1 hypothetical protein [Chryseobacterium koreense]